MAGYHDHRGKSHGSASPQDRLHDFGVSADEESADVLSRVRKHVEAILDELQRTAVADEATSNSDACVDEMQVLREKMIRETIQDLESVLGQPSWRRHPGLQREAVL